MSGLFWLHYLSFVSWKWFSTTAMFMLVFLTVVVVGISVFFVTLSVLAFTQIPDGQTSHSHTNILITAQCYKCLRKTQLFNKWIHHTCLGIDLFGLRSVSCTVILFWGLLYLGAALLSFFAVVHRISTSIDFGSCYFSIIENSAESCSLPI